MGHVLATTFSLTVYDDVSQIMALWIKIRESITFKGHFENYYLVRYA